MAIVPREDLADTLMACWWCDWFGTAAEAICPPDDIVRCPRCGEPLFRRNIKRPAVGDSGQRRDP